MVLKVLNVLNVLKVLKRVVLYSFNDHSLSEWSRLSTLARPLRSQVAIQRPSPSHDHSLLAQVVQKRVFRSVMKHQWSRAN